MIKRAQPFVKWAGGKRQLLPAILHRLPTKMRTYFEPFLGGGAVFFALESTKAFEQALIGDNNPELMNTYLTLSRGDDALEAVIALLKTYPYEPEFFEATRKKMPLDLDEVERAARFIYLNKTCFNGLYRVNKRGGFNAPFGRYTNPRICDEGNLRMVAHALQNKVQLTQLDFESQVSSAQEGDVVYFDPPYMPVSLTASFTEYMAGGFRLAEQERLASCVRTLASRGVKVLLSNSDTPKVRELYEGLTIESLLAKRSINSNGKRRGPVGEVLVSANL